MKKRVWVSLCTLALLTSLIGCNDVQPQPATMDPSVSSLLVTSDAFQAEGTIPQLYTCDGEDLSLPLHWSDPPAGTQSLALIFDDVDAPGSIWVHWLLFDIPAGVRSLPEGGPAGATVAGLGVHGANSWGNLGYGGPCPPKGSPHRYTFRLYALDTLLDLDARASRAELDQAMQGHILGSGLLMGRYGR